MDDEGKGVAVAGGGLGTTTPRSPQLLQGIMRRARHPVEAQEVRDPSPP